MKVIKNDYYGSLSPLTNIEQIFWICVPLNVAAIIFYVWSSNVLHNIVLFMYVLLP